MSLIEQIPAIGETMSAAWLFNPFEDEDAAIEQAKQALAYTALHAGVLLGDMETEVTTPDDQRITGVDDDGDWPRGTLVAIASARITSVAMPQEVTEAIQFIHSLTQQENAALRAHTRKIAAQYGRDLTDGECDAFIGSFGPQIARDQLKKLIEENSP